MSEEIINEARRQVDICNACRYCEGFCSVFPALQQLRTFSTGDLTQLANLCHNCRACHYSCQYSSPHEFRINIPRAMADVRVDSWQNFVRPRWLSRAFQHHGVLIAIVLVVSMTLLMLIMSSPSSANSGEFYAYMPHNTMVAVFAPLFVGPLLLIALAIRSYWQEVGGQRVLWIHLSGAIRQIAALRDLSGGQGQGCNFEQEDKYSNARRYLHQATMFGFLMCFASTSTATLMHYLLNLPAPYSWYSLPKLLGVPGGILLVIGCTGLGALKFVADPSLGARRVWGAEMAFVMLLGLTGLTGLVLYAVTGSEYVGPALTIHLASVLSLFVLLPFSKMVHGFFRMAALIRNEQTKI